MLGVPDDRLTQNGELRRVSLSYRPGVEVPKHLTKAIDDTFPVSFSSRFPPARRGRVRCPRVRRAGHGDEPRGLSQPFARKSALPGEGQVRHLPVHGRRAEPRRSHRPEARTHQTERQAAARELRQGAHADGHRRQQPARLANASSTKYGKSGLDFSRLAAAHGDVRRRLRAAPGLLGRRPQPRRQRLPDEHRLVLAGRPSLGSWAVYGLGTREPEPARVRRARPTAAKSVGGAKNWGTGYMPATYQGTPFRNGPNPILNLNTPARVECRPAAGQARPHREAERHPSPRAARRHATRRPPGRLRTRLPHAGHRPRGRRSVAGRRQDEGSLRPEPQGDRRVRPPLLAGAPAGRTRRPLRAGLLRRRQRLGRPLGPRRQPHAALRPRRPADRGTAQGPEAARPARRHARDLGRRVRPHADDRGHQRPRPQPVRLLDVDGRRRA